MRWKFLFALPLAGVMGCQTATRTYDGVLGYQVTPLSPSKLELTYVDEGGRSWEKVEARAQKACAHALGAKVALTILDIHEKTQLMQPVAMPVVIPVSPGAITRSSSSAGAVPPGAISHSSVLHQNVGREMSLKKLRATCEVRDGV